MGNCQRDHEDRIRDQSKTIGHLQNDLEVTKKSIRDRQEEGIQIHEQTQQVKRAIDDRNAEIARTNADLESVRIHNDSIRRDIDGLH